MADMISFENAREAQRALEGLFGYIRIKKGVRPFGGRKFPIHDVRYYPLANGGKGSVDVQIQNGHVGWQADIRSYSLHEVEPLDDRARDVLQRAAAGDHEFIPARWLPLIPEKSR
jgi:hypothetical protein